MKQYRTLIAFIALMLAVSLACGGDNDTPTAAPIPTREQSPAQPATQESGNAPSPAGSSDFVIFTDQNDLFQIEVPGDWEYTQTVDTESNNYYIDTFTSPDGGAVVESIVYDDGTTFTGNQTATFALYLLNTFYSSTGKEGDIKVTEDSIQKDGSERLTWTSKEGGYSGVSFLELRNNKTTFLFFTANWGDAVEDQYLDTVNQIIASYSVP